ncbi:hypothetical protein [Verminephrobacter aporrectodeae]|uniref:hypothetical protein n=1 Tax=Verminephrobacter aporrectodeae TaxID=1110389 RepID=UPI00223728D4|nr:hypothetical protein [Verminephrobacter aporrectodeae]
MLHRVINFRVYITRYKAGANGHPMRVAAFAPSDAQSTTGTAAGQPAGKLCTEVNPALRSQILLT